MSQENVEIVRGVRIALPRLGESAIQRRTVEERAFVRFPALYPLVAKWLNRLSPGSRIRRTMLARLVPRAYAAGTRRDFEFLLMGLDPGMEFRPTGGLWAVDLDTVVHGRDEYRAVWETTIEAFEDIRLEPEEVIDIGDRLLVTVEYRGHGSGSGVPVNQRVYQLLETRRGLVTKIEDFTDRSEAQEAAGLRE